MFRARDFCSASAEHYLGKTVLNKPESNPKTNGIPRRIRNIPRIPKEIYITVLDIKIIPP